MGNGFMGTLVGSSPFVLYCCLINIQVCYIHGPLILGMVVFMLYGPWRLGAVVLGWAVLINPVENKFVHDISYCFIISYTQAILAKLYI